LICSTTVGLVDTHAAAAAAAAAIGLIC